MTGSFSADRALHLKTAVHRSRSRSYDGFLERTFTFLFKGLVYPQIWEDSEVDMDALALGPQDRVITIAAADLGHRITVAHAVATDFPSSDLFMISRFDRVFFSFSLSMIPPWEISIANAMNHLVPGGQLHVVDFGDQSGLPKWFRSLLRSWLTRFHVSPRENPDGTLRAIAEAHRGVLAYKPLYRGCSVLGRIVIQ